MKKSIIFFIFMTLSLYAKADGVCSCGYQIQIFGITIWSENHEYWGSDNCYISYGATLSDYYMLGYEYNTDVQAGEGICGGSTAQSFHDVLSK